MTNREWLNGLSDEFLADVIEVPNCCCFANEDDCYGKPCNECFVDWLKKEHEEDGEASKEAD